MFQYPHTNRRTVRRVACLWLAAMVLAVLPIPTPSGWGPNLDERVATWAYWHAADRDHFANEVMKLPGESLFALAVALALWTWHPTRWRAAGHLALSGLLGGIVYALAKWTAGRVRPVKGIEPFKFEPFINGWQGLLGAENMSFPSGHTTLAFATAACLAINVPRWRYAFYAAAAVCGAERVAENAHYLSDVIAGAGVGTFSAYAVHWVERALHRNATRNDPSLPLETSPGSGSLAAVDR